MIQLRRILIFIIAIVLQCCNSEKLMVMIAKSPKISIQEKENPSWNKYQKDAFYLVNVIKQSYPKLHTKIDSIEFENQFQKLLVDLSQITNDFDFKKRIQFFVAQLKDGHSYVNIKYPIKEKTIIPVVFSIEQDDFIIGALDKRYDSIIGSRVLSINSIPISEIKKKILAYESAENIYGAYKNFREKAYSDLYWQALGILTNNQRFLTIQAQLNDSLIKTIQVESTNKYLFYQPNIINGTNSITRIQNSGFAYKMLKNENIGYLQMNTCLDFVAYKSEIDNYTNFILRPFALHFLKKRTENAQNFGIFLKDFFREIEQNKIDNIVLDLRNNSGGDERLGKQFIWYLTEIQDIKGFNVYTQVSDYYKQQMKKYFKKTEKEYIKKYHKKLQNGLYNIDSLLDNRLYFNDITKKGSPFFLDSTITKFKGNVFVLVGAKTFSAAQILATTLKDNNLATIVGTPVGNKPTTQSAVSLLKLPKTKTIVYLSFSYFERPDKLKNNDISLFPDFEIWNKAVYFYNGNDRQFEFIMTKCKK